MAETVLDLDADTLRRIKVEAAQSEEPPKAIAVRALEAGLKVMEIRRNAGSNRNADRATFFRLWLIEAKGYKPGAARTLSSLARKAVQSGSTDRYILARPDNGRSAAKSAVKWWNQYCEIHNFDPMVLDV